MIPTNRAELIELMARAFERYRTDKSPDPSSVYGVQDILKALTANGLAIVPIEATEGMDKAARYAIWSCGGIDQGGAFVLDDDAPQQALTAMLNASPYKETVEYKVGVVR